ncbi:unnamed protein product [Amaranthus hypochondriacus]
MGSVRRREKVEDCDEGLILNCLIGSVRKGEKVGKERKGHKHSLLELLLFYTTLAAQIVTGILEGYDQL